MTESDTIFRRQLACAAITGGALNPEGRHLLDLAREAWALADAMLYSEGEDSSDLWPYEVPTDPPLEDGLLPAVPQSEPVPAGEWPFPTPEEKAAARDAELEAARQARLARLRPDTVPLPIGAGMVAQVPRTLDLRNEGDVGGIAEALMAEPEPGHPANEASQAPATLPVPVPAPVPVRRITLQQAWPSVVASGQGVEGGAE